MSTNTYKKSSVSGGSWSTPFGTPFFTRWGAWSLKVPMAQLREEYEAWEKLQRRSEPEPPKPSIPLPSFPSGPFDWAEDVEQELFSGTTNDFGTPGINLDGKLDTDCIISPIVDQVVPEGVAVVGAGTALCTALKEGEEEDVTRDEKTTNLDSIDLTDTDTDTGTDPTPLGDSTPLDNPTPSTNADNTVYRIINISMTGNDFSLHMVEDGTTTSGTSNPKSDATNPASTANEIFDAIQLLSTAGLLNLDTYATVFDTASRACTAGPAFWLNDPLGGCEIVTVAAGLCTSLGSEVIGTWAVTLD